MSRNKSVHYFHTVPENLNCAQAVLKGFQEQFKITNQEIEEFRAWGGGRAEGGLCGALFAAEHLLCQAKKDSIVENFKTQAGGILCSELKGKKFACADCVQLADQLIEERIKN